MGQFILQNFTYFREHGLYSADMDEIEAVLRKVDTNF